MKSFNELGITTTKSNYKGDKIKTERLINRAITVYEFKIKDSIKEPGKPCLHIQIAIGETYHVVFTSGTLLMEQIQMVAAEDFPFTTTIVRDNDYLKFT